MLALAQLAGVTLIAAVVQGALGFGFSLLAVSFFLLIIQSGDAVQLLIIINLTISLALVGRIWQDLDRGLWRRLLIGALLGLPVGLIVFQEADIDQLKILVAIAILTFVALIFLRPSSTNGSSGPAVRFRTPSAVGVGALAGAMTIAMGMPGPALVLYLTAIGTGRDATRAMSLTFFAVTFAVSLTLQTVVVGVSTEVWITAGLLLPVAGVGALLGHAVSGRLSESIFRRVVLTLVAATGAYVLLDAVLS